LLTDARASTLLSTIVLCFLVCVCMFGLLLFFLLLLLKGLIFVRLRDCLNDSHRSAI